MAFDFKKEHRDLYRPKTEPSIIEVPRMRFITVEGEGDPNEEGGAYKEAIGLLYGIAYTIKMSYKTEHAIPGFFEYVVPPLEGFWWQPGINGVDFRDKASFRWVSAIRVPEFATDDEFSWAVQEASKKKGLDYSPVKLIEIEEGLCVQCMHIGPYNDEPATVAAMHRFAESSGYVSDFSDERRHHEIYLSDPGKTAPEKMKTVVRHPIKNA